MYKTFECTWHQLEIIQMKEIQKRQNKNKITQKTTLKSFETMVAEPNVNGIHKRAVSWLYNFFGRKKHTKHIKWKSPKSMNNIFCDFRSFLLAVVAVIFGVYLLLFGKQKKWLLRNKKFVAITKARKEHIHSKCTGTHIKKNPKK